MRYVALLTLVIFISTSALCQQQKIDSVKFQIKNLEEQKKEIDQEIRKLNETLSDLVTVPTNNTTDQFIIAKCIDSPCRLIAKAIDLGPSNDDVMISKGEFIQVDYDTERYQTFFPALYNGKAGFINKRSVKLPGKKNDDSNDPLYSTSTKKSKTKTSSSPSFTSTPSRNIQTGPRGGRYYINKNGKKTYVKKK